MIGALLKKGLTPAVDKWLKVIFANDPYEADTIAEWFVDKGLGENLSHCQEFLTADNILATIIYIFNNNEAEKIVHNLGKLTRNNPTEGGYQFTANQQKHLLEMLWNYTPDDPVATSKAIISLAKLGVKIPFIEPKMTLYLDYEGKKPTNLHNVGILFRAMVQNKEIFQALSQEKNLETILLEDLKKHEKILPELAIEADYFPYLLKAKVDLNLKNTKKETVLFAILNHWQIKKVPQELHQYLVDNFSELDNQRNTKRKNCFEAWKDENANEPKVTFKGKKYLMSAYRLLVIKANMQSLVPASEPGKGGNKLPRKIRL